MLSLVIPVHNQRAFLRASVLSALGDAGADTEILVVDDGSTDASAETVADLPVTILKRPRRGGPAAARNTGLARARGDLVAFLDGDDRLVPGGLRWRREYLDRHPQAPAVAGIVESVLGSDGFPLPDLYHPGNPPPGGLPLTGAFFRRGGSLACALTVTLFRRERVEQTGPFSEDLRCGEDLDFLLRALERGPIPWFPRPVLQYRVHGANQSLALRGDTVEPRPWAKAAAFFLAARHLRPEPAKSPGPILGFHPGETP